MDASKPALSALALFFALLLAACGPDVPQGVWKGVYDPEDRIEILSSTRARVTALRGERIDIWLDTSPGVDEFNRQIKAARRALAQLEMVDVAYDYDARRNMLVFTSEARGSRELSYNRTDIIDDPGSALRAYLLQK